MMTRRSAPTARDRFLSLLRAPHDRRSGPFASPTREALAAARDLDRAAAGEVVAAVLAEYEPGADSSPAERAAHVAHELALAEALPALATCLSRLPQGDRVASVACATLALFGRPAVPPLLAALRRAATAEARFAVGFVLALAAPDERTRAAFEGLAPEDPETATRLLRLLGTSRRDAVAAPA